LDPALFGLSIRTQRAGIESVFSIRISGHSPPDPSPFPIRLSNCCRTFKVWQEREIPPYDKRQVFWKLKKPWPHTAMAGPFSGGLVTRNQNPYQRALS
jgi:hypothetical protein